jgi:hypothetical protein
MQAFVVGTAMAKGVSHACQEPLIDGAEASRINNTGYPAHDRDPVQGLIIADELLFILPETAPSNIFGRDGVSARNSRKSLMASSGVSP